MFQKLWDFLSTKQTLEFLIFNSLFVNSGRSVCYKWIDLFSQFCLDQESKVNTSFGHPIFYKVWVPWKLYKNKSIFLKRRSTELYFLPKESQLYINQTICVFYRSWWQPSEDGETNIAATNNKYHLRCAIVLYSITACSRSRGTGWFCFWFFIPPWKFLSCLLLFWHKWHSITECVSTDRHNFIFNRLINISFLLCCMAFIW